MSAPENNQSLDFLNGTPWFLNDCTLELDTNHRRVALFILYLFVFVAGLLENTLVVWVNWRRRHSADGVLFCVINMSLSDLMVVAVLPFFMMEVTMDKVWLWGRFLCKVTNLIYMINFYSSSFFLTFMTLERYLSLARPSSPAVFPPLSRRRWLFCGGLWTFSLFLALMENVHVDLLELGEPGCYMMPEYNFIDWFVTVAFFRLLFQFLGPAAAIVTCNVLIARAVKAAPDVRERRELWLVHVYSAVFVACWLPYHAVVFLMIVEDLNRYVLSCNAFDALYFSYALVDGLSLLHCVANPILYNFLSKSFRHNLINAVADRLPRGGPGGSGDPEKPRKTSSGDTSQSDVGS
ncbi:G-protein coupled receptor 182 [Brachionichthys hirsutus]|uniref:G-protein coupled receptor 182 n=1 Tax=Brachionichthys hirsutus TaxID=412623 RepID=UPI003604E0F9